MTEETENEIPASEDGAAEEATTEGSSVDIDTTVEAAAADAEAEGRR
jgi:hypothetical protein